MNKTIILLSSMLLITAGCNTQQVIKVVQNTAKEIPESWPGSNNTNQQSATTDEDIEDASCAKISYEKRTICRIQVHLNALGYKVGSEDGIAGNNTKRGIRKFQSKHNVKPINGKPSFELLTMLRKEHASGTNPLLTGGLSATACAAIAIWAKKDPAMWGMICGAGGAILQGLSNKGKEEYAMRYYEIKDENDRTENEINQIARQTRNNENKTRSYKSEIESLIANEKDDRLFIEKAEILRGQLDDQARKSKRERSKAEVKIAILDNQINDIKKILEEKPNEEEFEKTLASLKTKKATLIDAIDQSNSLEKELIAQKNMLYDEIIERS